MQTGQTKAGGVRGVQVAAHLCRRKIGVKGSNSCRTSVLESDRVLYALCCRLRRRLVHEFERFDELFDSQISTGDRSRTSARFLDDTTPEELIAEERHGDRRPAGAEARSCGARTAMMTHGGH